jgi:hypothetical protein
MASKENKDIVCTGGKALACAEVELSTLTCGKGVAAAAAPSALPLAAGLLPEAPPQADSTALSTVTPNSTRHAAMSNTAACVRGRATAFLESNKQLGMNKPLKN